MYNNTTGNESAVLALEFEIKSFRRRFNSIKDSTIKCLEKCKISVMMVVFMLTSIEDIDQHKTFLQGKVRTFHQCHNNWELFSLLNFYWNYLSYDLLDQLIETLVLQNRSFESLRGEMAEYKHNMQTFRKRTTLELFCHVQPSPLDNDDPPPGFMQMVVQFNWPGTSITLEDVEIFRKRYARKYDLKQCAFMIGSIRKG